MADLKTVPNEGSVTAFLDGVADERKRQDCYAILELMKEVTETEPMMWGPSIVGFGRRHYKYASGHEGDTFIVGFSPRKEAITLYLPTYLEYHTDLLGQLGKHKIGKGCLYVKRLSDVDVNVLKMLIAQTARQV